jgi:hypothetical protein
MCGVIGLLLKDPGLEPELGSMLVPMLGALGDRGPDSSGIAVYADGDPFNPGLGRAGPRTASSGDPVTRVSLGSDREVDWAALAADLESRATIVGRRPLVRDRSGSSVDVRAGASGRRFSERRGPTYGCSGWAGPSRW